MSQTLDHVTAHARARIDRADGPARADEASIERTAAAQPSPERQP